MRSAPTSQKEKHKFKGKMDLDEVYSRIGEIGRQQKIYFGIALCAQLINAIHMVNMVFIGSTPKFSCLSKKAGALPEVVDACELFRNIKKCPRIKYDSDWKTLSEEMDLICDDAYKVGLAQSVFMAGVLVGSLLFGIVSDSIGRLKTLWITVFILLGSSSVLGLAPSFRVFIILRFLIGFAIAGHGISMFVLVSELIGGSVRAAYTILNSVSFAVGICILTAFARLSADWRQFSHLLAFFSFLIFLLYLKLPESPRWLLGRGDVLGTKKVLQRVAKGNGMSAEDVVDWEIRRPLAKDASAGLTSILGHWPLLKWTLIQIYSWFANSAVYYGLTMAAGGLSSDLHASVLLSGLAEIPAYTVILLLQTRIGRKPLICGSMLVGGSACVSILLLEPDAASARTTLALLGKMGISASFACIYLHSSELFPTVIRNGGLGLCATAARVGGVVAPLISSIGTWYPTREFVVFGLIGLSSGLLNLRLPETAGKPLPETIPDVLKLSRPSSPKIQKILFA